jgi:hypothetical protein
MPLPDIIREYGQAFRGDWSPSTIDGRTVREEMNYLAKWVEHPQTYPGDADARGVLGLCALGSGHWADHCSSYKCEEVSR